MRPTRRTTHPRSCDDPIHFYPSSSHGYSDNARFDARRAMATSSSGRCRRNHALERMVMRGIPTAPRGTLTTIMFGAGTRDRTADPISRDRRFDVRAPRSPHAPFAARRSRQRRWRARLRPVRRRPVRFRTIRRRRRESPCMQVSDSRRRSGHGRSLLRRHQDRSPRFPLPREGPSITGGSSTWRGASSSGASPRLGTAGERSRCPLRPH